MNDNEELARAWDEGYKAGGDDSGALLGWSHRATVPPYDAGLMPEHTPNPYHIEARS